MLKSSYIKENILKLKYSSNLEISHEKLIISKVPSSEIYKFIRYLQCESTKVKSSQLFNACNKDKHYKRQNNPQKHEQNIDK